MTVKKPSKFIAIFFLSIVVISAYFPVFSYCSQSEVKIGVLANWGNEAAIKKWEKTGTYLTRHIPTHVFTIVPLGFNEIVPAVSQNKVDFVVANPEIYVDLEANYGTSRIATLKNKIRDTSYKVFGGVIFCRADRFDIQNLRDLVGKKFMAVEEASLGGWTMAWREFKSEAIDPRRDFSEFTFGGRQDTVVYAVRDRKVEAGTVRTDTLERLADEGKIDIADYRILNRQHIEKFPILLSTRLYPEWPFAKVKSTSDELAQEVAIALLNMPSDDPAALSASSEGWTIPLDYQPVHELMKELQIGAYKDYGKTTLSSTLRQYRYWFASVLLLLLLMVFTITYVIRINRILHQSQMDLEKSRDELEIKVKERTVELEIEIAERSQAVEALRESEHRFREVLENVHMVALTLDGAGNITFCNNHLLSLTGWSWNEIIGKNWFDIFLPAGDDLTVKKIFAEAMATASLPSHNENPIKTRSGALRLIAWDNILLKNAGGSVVGAASIGIDVTDHRNTEAQLLQAQKMESVGRLAGGVAHDFNNMLTAIIGHAGLAKMQCTPSEPIHAHLNAIEDSAHRSADLTRQLLAFARKQTVAPKVLDINDTVSGMLKMLQRMIGEDLDLVWMPGANLWQVKIDPSQIDQLLANLCVNARDSIAGVGKVTIETKNNAFDEAYCTDHMGFACGEYVMLAVSDNGCGINKETLPHIFEPFFTTKEVGKGTGLGLATVYGIVKQNNGFINVYSEPEKGTTFKIYLPRVVGEAIELSAESTVETPKGHGETVLLVEDEPVILGVSKEMLEQLGYAVLIADTPVKALHIAKIHAAEIQMLITDVVMPEMNGRDLAKLICDIKPGLKCLYISGYTADVIAHHGVLDPDVNFIQKPFSMKHLAVKVRELLGYSKNSSQE